MYRRVDPLSHPPFIPPQLPLRLHPHAPTSLFIINPIGRHRSDLPNYQTTGESRQPFSCHLHFRQAIIFFWGSSSHPSTAVRRVVGVPVHARWTMFSPGDREIHILANVLHEQQSTIPFAALHVFVHKMHYNTVMHALFTVKIATSSTVSLR